MSTLSTLTLRTRDIRWISTNAKSMEIDESGIVSYYNQGLLYYGWRDTGSESWENFGTTPTNYVYNIASLNAYTSYNVGTGVFTCPFEGVYYVCPSALFGQGGSYGYLYVYKNGLNETARGIHSNTNGANLWHLNSYTFPILCSAGDQLEVKIITGNANVYGREHSHLSIWAR